MPIDQDGSVIPSTLALASTARYWDGGKFSDTQMHYGEVQDIIYPDDKNSKTKKYIEYTVYCQFRGSGGVGTGRLYFNCLLSNHLSGLADYESFTLRGENSIKDKDTKGLGKGSKVLICCINGETSSPIIIGGMRDPKDETEENYTKDQNPGHNYKKLFNGISHVINKDGELIISYNGKTDIDGSTNSDVDSSAPGSTITMEKDGGIKIFTKDSKQLVQLDNANGKVIIKRENALEIGDATDKMLLGESFRNAQQELHIKLMAQLTLLQNTIQQAATQLITAAATPIPPGGVLATLAPAGALLVVASQVIGKLGEAINDFENAAGQKNGFISRKNSSD